MKTVRNSAIIALVFINLFSIAVHLWEINTPPAGDHIWRQCLSASVARNFFDEDMNLFRPRVDERGKGDGITGMEFPIIYWIIAWTYKFFGFNHWSGRMVVVLLSVLGNFYFYLIVRRFVSQRAALLSTCIFILSPLYFFYSRTMLPDVPALAMALGAFYFYLRMNEIRTAKFFILALMHVSLAGLIKIPYISVIFFIFIYHILLHRESILYWKIWIKMSLLIAIGSTLPLIWWLHCKKLQSLSGIYAFALTPGVCFDLSLYRHALNGFISIIPEYMLSYPIVFFFISFLFVSVILCIEPISKSVRLLLLSWFLTIGFHLFFLVSNYLNIHNYYWMPLLPPLALCAGIGIDSALRLWKPLTARVILFMTLLFIPISYHHNYLDLYHIPSPFFQPILGHLESLCDRHIPAQSRIIMAPDASRCIMFYFAHRKGWAFYQLDSTKLEQAVTDGGHFLVSGDSTFWMRPEVKEIFPQTIYREGNLAILASKQAQALVSY